MWEKSELRDDIRVSPLVITNWRAVHVNVFESYVVNPTFHLVTNAA